MASMNSFSAILYRQYSIVLDNVQYNVEINNYSSSEPDILLNILLLFTAVLEHNYSIAQ